MADKVKKAAADYKAAKKAYKRARRKNVSGWKFLGIFTTVMTVILSAVTVFLNAFDNTIAAFVGGSFTELYKADKEAVYFKNDYLDTNGEVDMTKMLDEGNELCYKLEAEGAALLMNNGALPLAKGSKVSTLSSNSVDLVYGGTGSGNVDASQADSLKECLENAGFEVNGTLWDFYLSEKGSTYRRTAGSGESAVLAGHASIAEVPIKEYGNALDSIESYNDAVIITISRVGGEGYDLNFHGILPEKDEDGKENKDRNYLALNETEREMMQYAEDLKAEGKIENIVVLVNTSNALQMDFLLDYDVDACLWVGGLGFNGTQAVADILAGKVNPSGSLVDTYCYDNYSSPAMQNFVATTYGGAVSEIPSNASTYMIYQEGIYVGYKYYETRYEDYVMGQGNADGNITYQDWAGLEAKAWKYSDDVAFPFGYGLSYSEFEYSDYSVTDKGATLDVTVTITNVSDIAGKETVQIYSQAPYTQYDKDNGVEKASVNLVGFDKVDLAAAGEEGDSKTVTIEIDKRDIASYDAYGAGTYILDEGTYYLTAATDAHNAVNNILAAKGYTVEDGMDAEGNAALVGEWTQETFDAVTYSTSLNGTPITNQLSDADLNLYEGNADHITYLSRSNWVATWPATTPYVIHLSQPMIDELQEGRYDHDKDYYDYPEAWNTMPKLNQKNGLKLYDMFEADDDKDGIPAAQDYNDTAWNKLLENVTIDELIAIGDSFHWRLPLESIHAPGTRDENGPQGLTASLIASDKTEMKATAFTSEDVMAATFNTELIYQVGKMIGNNCLAANVACLYGPGANTHRTPYGGRNFEYYSEDGFLAGEMGGAEVGGIQEKGVDVVMKHFALNDCEQDRLGQAAWVNEQAAREIYLKAFQKSLEESDGNGVMTAYTRWGTTWSGGHQGLMSGIMRGEWGNKGMSITDNILVTYTNAVDAVLAGGVTCFDAMLWYATEDLEQAKNDPVAVNAMVEAMHHNLYALINSSGMNGVGPDTTVKKVAPIVNTVCTVAAIVFGAIMVISYILWIRGNAKIKSKLLLYKKAKHDYKKLK